MTFDLKWSYTHDGPQPMDHLYPLNNAQQQAIWRIDPKIDPYRPLDDHWSKNRKHPIGTISHIVDDYDKLSLISIAICRQRSSFTSVNRQIDR